MLSVPFMMHRVVCFPPRSVLLSTQDEVAPREVPWFASWTVDSRPPPVNYASHRKGIPATFSPQFLHRNPSNSYHIDANDFSVAEREAGGETEMGLAASREITKGYHAGVPGGLRAEYHGEEASHVRP